MGLMKELNDLNAIYQKMNEGKATPESGTGKYYKEGQPTKQQLANRAKREKIKQLTNQGKHKEASALHNEDYETQKKKEVLSALDRDKRPLSKKDKDKIANKVVKDKGDTSKSDDRYAYEDFQPSEIVVKLVESGKFSIDELWKIVEVEEGYQRDPEGGEEKERQRRRSQKGGDRTEKVRGERSPMPPRGYKRREDFERWYAANVR